MIAAAGCGGEATRVPIRGSVTLDGAPLADGQITLVPLAATNGPTAGAPIVDGSFAISADQGPTVGSYRVEITAMRVTSKQQRTMNTATGQLESVPAYESIVPPRYNRNSELSIEVTAHGPNEFSFPLTSK